MSNFSPNVSQSPSKENNDSIDEQRKAVGHVDDEFEDSLNVSISEHISEEIESNEAEDSIDAPAFQIDQKFVEKKRKLFNFDDSDKSDVAASDGIRKFTKLDTSDDDDKFDELLSGENIVKHFIVENEIVSSSSPCVNERVQSASKHITNSDNTKIDSADDGAASNNSQTKINVSTSQRGSDAKEAKKNSDGLEKDPNINDVILINDHEISITSLKQLQKQRSHSDTDQSAANQTNQNTTSDISDLLNEDKEQKTTDDISIASVNDSRPTSSKRDDDKAEEQSEHSTKSKRSREDFESQDKDEEMEITETIQKCKPLLIESPIELSIIEEVSAAEEMSSNRNLIGSNSDKKNEIRKILIETVNKLPLEKENRPPNLRDELLSVDSKCLNSSQNSITTDGTVYNAFAKTAIPFDLESDFESELNLNLIHMQNKIKELQNLSTGKYSALDLPISGRRDSLKDSLKDYPQSGRESTSITTNSTEYRPFQDEYFRLTHIQMALSERDRIIQELTDSLKQSIDIRDQLNQRNEQLTNEAKQLRAARVKEAKERRKWFSEDNEQRLSETTIDLVSESEFEDDEYYKRSQRQSQERIEPKPEVPSNTISNSVIPKVNENDAMDGVDALKKELTELKEKLVQEQMEKSEIESEANRLRLLLMSIKDGTADMVELRTELEDVHKKEMEMLRMYFERKCTDLEKQYSEEVFSQHSRRHSNNTNSDLSDDELFLPDDNKSGSVRRSSKTGDILASPTHRKLTPTHIRSTGSSPSKRISKMDRNVFRSLDDLHTHYATIIADMKHSHEETVKNLKYKLRALENPQNDEEYLLTTTSKECPLVLLTSDQVKSNNEYAEMFNNLVIEYDRRLIEQVKQAKEDVLNELEIQIQTLLSEPAPDESRWPSELILLREKFTAKSQLEIAQLQIKHEEEMSKLKIDHQKQLERKIKRQTDFDSGRDLEKCETERDSLRELCNTFHQLLYELARCVSMCESDLNASLVDELNKFGLLPQSSSSPNKPLSSPTSPTPDPDFNLSICSSIGNHTLRTSFLPDVSGIISLIENQSLLNFVTEKFENDDATNESVTGFNLNDCLEKLKLEADSLLHLSERLINKKYIDNRELDRKNKSFEEEDGLKCIKDDLNVDLNEKPRLSLPTYLPNDKLAELQRKTVSSPDLNHLKNCLLLAETKNQELQNKLAETEKKLTESIVQQTELRVKLNSLESQSEELSEGYGISQLRSPQREHANKCITSFSALQERAKHLFNNNSNATENVSQMLQLIEDFCREGEKLIEDENEAKKNLQAQIDFAYEQRVENLEFMKNQAAEREMERDEFGKKIDKLETKLRDVDKERLKYEHIAKESELLKQQIQEMESSIESQKLHSTRIQNDLKESISKIYDLREIIVELEKQVKEKDNQLKALENDMSYQKTANETLQMEMKSLLSQSEIAPTYEEKIQHLEEQLESLQPNSEQCSAIERIAGYLREIEDNLDRKTNLLESIHVTTGTVTTCSSPSEDVSVRGSANNLDGVILSPRNFKYLAKDPSFPVDQIMRIIEKMQKHSKVEEAAIKLVRDLEMQIKVLHTNYLELQNERDLLKERMDEQMMRLTTIQSRLDEQRQRAEELQRAGTSDLNLKLYDLQAEVTVLNEKISSRDKQVRVLQDQLKQSKEIIDRQEAEIATYNSGTTDGSDSYSKSFVEKLEAEMVAKNHEIKQLKEKMRTEMITKIALPDLMETMLADKTDEIDYLKDQLDSREKEIKTLHDRQVFSKAEEKLSDVFLRDSDSSHPDIIRRMPERTSTSLDPIKIFGLNEMSFDNMSPVKPRQILFTSKSINEANTISVQSIATSSLKEIPIPSIELANNGIDIEIEKLKATLREATAENKQLKMGLDAEKARLTKDIDRLNQKIDELKSKVDATEEQLTAANEKCTEVNTLNRRLKEERANNTVVKQQLTSMGNTIKLKDELISKLQKEMFNYAQNEKIHLETIGRLQKENSNRVDDANSGNDSSTNQQLHNEIDRLKETLALTEQELADKMIAYEKCLLDIADHEKTIFHLNDVLTDSKTARSVEELRIQIRSYRERNDDLKDEIEKLKQKLLQNERSVSPAQIALDEIGIDEITSRVQKELNYSAQLDSNIMKAIESDELNSDNENYLDHNENEEFEMIRARNKQLEMSIEKLQRSLESEKEKFSKIHKQDANCIETMTTRLETAIMNETELTKMLDEEKSKTAQLSTKILEHQFERSKLSASNLSLNELPISSPRRLQKNGEMDQELLKRQNDEIKLLKSQLEREKERALDTVKTLAREKDRFEKELNDQKSYGESLKDELDRIMRENQSLQDELEQTQDRLTISSREIENLQSRIKSLQETDNYRAARHEKDRNELTQSYASNRELKDKLIKLERERDLLQERVSILQADIDRGAQREARLTESLTNVAGYSMHNQHQSNGVLMPQQLLSKLKEMNEHLSENVRENRQLSETLQLLTDERHILQKKVQGLERMCVDRDELEERANHLFGKYLRTESFRRALIHQKRYLMIVLNTYETNESKVLSAFNGNITLQKKRKTPSFKSVVLVAVAIERMKFILKRWQTGKRVCAKNTIFAHSTPPRRTHSASTINWTRQEMHIPNVLYHPQSPPSRDRTITSVLKGRRCTNNDFTNPI